jgi:general nucleoside transport system permease protein
MNDTVLNTLNSVVSNATPLVFAAIGETITERAGVINLSLDGSLALSALAGFVAALTTGSVWIGVATAMLTGALVALLIAFGAIALRQDQVAVGFVLTLLAADLAQFLGQSYARKPGPTITPLAVPFLEDLPVIGPVLFQHDLLVYLSYFLVFAVWYWLFRTRGGLAHRAVGERPAAAFARGTDVNQLRYLYTVIGGSLVGLGGAAYSLSLKAGWSNPPAMRGDGWIALAIVIFGGWHPFRVVLGAYLFAGLRALSSTIQRSNSNISPVLLNAIPWVLMILTLILVSGGVADRLTRFLPMPLQRRARAFLRSEPPAALGTPFHPE